jgi:hypothetical protein
MSELHGTIDWNAIEGFIGYGNPSAAVVFVGLEEGLDSESNLDAELRLRSRFPAVIDLAKAFFDARWQRKLLDPGRTVSQKTWRPMCDLMLRRQGNTAPTLAERNAYQASRLGRSGQATLLTELLPYPNVGITSWPYAAYGRFTTRAEYAAAMIGPRITLLQATLSEPTHKLVVCYGKGQWENYKRLFPHAAWRSENGYEVADSEGKRILLTPHFSRPDFNEDRQLAEFARVALERSD